MKRDMTVSRVSTCESDISRTEITGGALSNDTLTLYKSSGNVVVSGFSSGRVTKGTISSASKLISIMSEMNMGDIVTANIQLTGSTVNNSVTVSLTKVPGDTFTASGIYVSDTFYPVIYAYLRSSRIRIVYIIDSHTAELYLDIQSVQGTYIKF